MTAEAQTIPEDISATVEDVFENEWMRPFRNDEAKAVVANALLAERERSQWRPIDTAPRTGETILLRLSNGEVFSGWCKGDGSAFRCHADGSDIGWLNAKHWMALPAAPKAEAA
jgi:hypothetical protein